MTDEIKNGPFETYHDDGRLKDKGTMKLYSDSERRLSCKALSGKG